MPGRFGQKTADADSTKPSNAMDKAPLIALAVVTVVTLIFMVRTLFGGKPGKKFLNKTRQQVTLSERIVLSHDSLRLRFSLPKETPVLGLPVGKHFKLFAPNVQGKVAGQWNGGKDPDGDDDEIERKYTPCTSDDEIGYVDLVIKVYKGGVIERFPDGGKMSQHLGAMKVGDKLTIQGPVGMNEYLGEGLFKVGSKQKKCMHLGMMAGGTGITPMLQVIAAVLKEKKRGPKLSLLYANQSEADILVRDLLEDLAAKHPDRFQLWYTVDRPPAQWKYSTGFITADMIEEHLPPPSAETLVLMCGPPPMIKYACQQNLDKLGYAKDTQVVF